MLNILEILFLIFGWIFHIKGLVIASLVISAIFFISLLLADIFEITEKKGISVGYDNSSCLYCVINYKITIN